MIDIGLVTQAMSLLGRVTSVDSDALRFEVLLRNGYKCQAEVGPKTWYNVLTNLDGVRRDTIPTPAGYTDTTKAKLSKYVRPGVHVFIQGIYLQSDGCQCFQARGVHLLHSDPDSYMFEETHWWLTQISRMADQWLDDLFDDNRDYEVSDFTKLYRTNLSIHGGPTDDNTQVAATLSRLIYGLSSAFLLTGSPRYLRAATAGVAFQRSSFRNLSHDGKYCFWSYGRRKRVHGTVTIVPSEAEHERGSIPLYEQIYALAGLAQYYRATGDAEVLRDIWRTVEMFDAFYLDDKSANPEFPGHGGYFSHLDPANMRPDSAALEHNRLRKNWNSIGDHIPAYLINVLLALDPLPADATVEMQGFAARCRQILDRCTDLILKYFPDADESIPYVRERFFADWTPDLGWRWQENRAIVGHNLKIAWNMTRLAIYYEHRDKARAKKAIELAEHLAKAMVKHGLDLARGGCFDAVERVPRGGVPIEFVWGNTKDFWQQEQGILAYLILYGYTGNTEYLELARDMSAFWNQFFLDRENVGIWFRTTENGMPVIEGDYVNRASYAMAGYHSFELNFLAHIYMRLYVSGVSQTDNTFCLFFRPLRGGRGFLNVLPDFLSPEVVEIAGLWVNGKDHVAPNTGFSIPLDDVPNNAEVIVMFKRKGKLQT